MSQELKEQVKALVRHHGSYEALAREIGVSWITIQRWVSGKTNPSPLAVRRIQELFSVLDGQDPQDESANA